MRIDQKFAMQLKINAMNTPIMKGAHMNRLERTGNKGNLKIN